MSINEVFRKAREEKGLKLREVARRTHLSHGYLSQIENGLRTNVGSNVLRIFSEAMDIEIILSNGEWSYKDVKGR